MTKRISIAIDGPAAAGKSTIAKIVAKNLSYVYIDTGAMYRALTLKALNENINLEDEKALAEVLNRTTIELVPTETGQLILLDGEDVTEAIRQPEVTNNVSVVSMPKLVREEMVRRQREFAVTGGVVMDGRDIGTAVLPNAELKLFMIASVLERAERRFAENQTKGINTPLETLMEEIARRDKLDSEREVSPLVKAEDAIELDTTSMTISEVVDYIMNIVLERVK